jgi:phosphatidate cytidylyltransferase
LENYRTIALKANRMLANRLKVVIILVPVGALFVGLGGWAFTALITAALTTCAWEYWRMFTQGGYHPSLWILAPGVAIIALARHIWGFQYGDLIIAVLVMASMGYHTIYCRRGIETPAVDFAITTAGLLYIGWLGSYLITLRDMDGGAWWVLLSIPAISLGDGGAYFIGRKFGKHPLAPHVSPNKTIEGYLGGVASAAIGGVLLALLWGLRYPAMTPIQGLILGLILGIFSPLGDLGESMLKRQFNVKDTSNIFPGHGGVLDRMDSWLWGAALSYLILLVIL